MKKFGFTLRAAESTGVGVLRMADVLIAAALCPGRRPHRSPLEEVHFFRTTTKRLRALLQLIRPALARTVFERENARLKRVADRLALFRDRAVASETLQALGLPAGILRQRKPSPGQRARALQQAARDLKEARGRWEKLRIRGEGWVVIGPGLLRVYRQARRRMKAAVGTQDDRAFHRWRIRVKQLSYQLQWFETVWPKRFGNMRQRLHQLEEILGCDHDLVSLRALLEIAAPLSDDRAALGEALQAADRKSRRLRRAAGCLGAKIFREPPRRFRHGCQQHWLSWVKTAGDR